MQQFEFQIILISDMQHSLSYKYPNLSFIEAGINEFQEIPHVHCTCFHCLNNTKPLSRPKAARIISKKEKRLNDSQAFRLILKQLAQHGFTGHAEAPDTYLIESSGIIYSSKSGKMRMKDAQTNIEVKRQFDEQRRKGQANLVTLNHVGGVISKMQVSQSLQLSSLQFSKANKQIALMSYKDNTEQIINESLLSKILQKRKNDPFWEEISHILQFPPQLRQPIQKYKYHYERTDETIPVLNTIMQRLGREIDNVEEKALIITSSYKPESRAGNYGEEDQVLQINPQLKINKPSSQKTARNHSPLYPRSKKNASIPESTSSYNFSMQQKLQELQLSSLQIVGFLEMTSHYRILNVVFEYFIDQRGRVFVCNTREVIGQQLQSNELTVIHDRYRQLQEIGIEEIVSAKKQYDSAQEQELWKICTAVVNESLEIRKIQLNLTAYKKPNYETLLKIFLKIFPDFKSEEIFSNKNWKNELTSLIADIRKKVNKIIREDEGIRILRRFGIEFRRTFH